MAKNISRRDFLKGLGVAAAGVATAGILGGCSSKESSTTSGGTYTPGTYTATATGMGTVKVTATFDAEKITDVVLDLAQETPSIGQAAAEELVNQIIEAQSNEIDGVSGATVTSKAVAKALGDCIKQAKGEATVTVNEDTTETAEEGVASWLGEEPETPDCSETIETDTVIVGAGNGGLMCGAWLTKLGNTKFVILEKLPTVGDTRHWYGAINTHYTKEAGSTIDIPRLKREVSRYASGKNSKEVLNTWINESADMADFIDELYAEMDPENTCTFTAGDEAVWPEDCQDGYMFPEQEHVWGRTGDARNVMLANWIGEHNEDAQILYNHDLIKLVKEDDKIVGVVAQNTDTDEYVMVKASNVVLATGGYPGNPDMMEQLDPLGTSVTTACSYAPQDTGMGIKAAIWAGAKLQEEPAPMLFDRGIVAPGVDAGLTEDRVFPGTVRQFNLGTQPFLKVNRLGKRFTNESGPYNDMVYAAAQQPGHVYASILPADWADYTQIFHTIGCSAQTRNAPAAQQEALDGYVEDGLAFKADTIEELGAQLGLDEEGVANLVAATQKATEAYNKGEDEEFGKPKSRLCPYTTAPFYGFWLGASLLTTEQGIMINGKGQALNDADEVIDGLYVIGDCSGGMFSNNYPCLMPGIALGRTLTYGMKVAKVISGADE